jgi:hypothetical protein
MPLKQRKRRVSSNSDYWYWFYHDKIMLLYKKEKGGVKNDINSKGANN